MADFSILAVFDQPEQKLWGNTAAVVLLDSFPSKKNMQALARDINQPATTFLVATGTKDQYDVRWFAPDSEIRLCGHGTLAAVAFLNKEYEIQLNARNHVLRGKVTAENRATMDIEAILSEPAEIPEGLSEAMGVPIVSYHKTNNKDLVIIENEQLLVDMKPDFAALRNIDVFGYAVTAPGDTTDFVSRTIVPHVVQLEDHATGSSHAALAPYWAERLNKRQMNAIQRSPRGGSFGVEIKENMVRLSGHFTAILNSDLSYLHR
jgi:PhzF family phenazine biosynthesis protein